MVFTKLYALTLATSCRDFELHDHLDQAFSEAVSRSGAALVWSSMLERSVVTGDSIGIQQVGMQQISR